MQSAPEEQPQHEILTIEIPLPEGMSVEEARTKALVHLGGQTIEQALTCLLQDAGIDVPENADVILMLARMKRRIFVSGTGKTSKLLGGMLKYWDPSSPLAFEAFTYPQLYPQGKFAGGGPQVPSLDPTHEELMREVNEIAKQDEERRKKEAEEEDEEGPEEASA